MATRQPTRELPPLGRHARTLFRALFVLWIVIWATSFFVDSLVNVAHVVALFALLSGLAWVVSEMRNGHGDHT